MLEKIDYLRLLQRTDYYEISGNRMTSYCSGLGGGSINYWDGKAASFDYMSPITDLTAFVQILDSKNRINLLQMMHHYWQPDKIVSKYHTHSRAYVEEEKTIHDDTFVSLIRMHHDSAVDLIIRIDGVVNEDSRLEFVENALVIEEIKNVTNSSEPSRIFKIVGFNKPTHYLIDGSRYSLEFPISLKSSMDYDTTQYEHIVLVVSAGDTREEALRRFHQAMKNPRKLFDDRKREWEDYFEKHVPRFYCDNPRIMKMYYFINYALKANIYNFNEGYFKHDFVTTAKFRFLASWFWDCAFSAINEKWLIGMDIPAGSILNIIEAQRQDGLLPFSLCKDGFTYGDWEIIQPFILPMAIWDYYLKSGDKELIKKALPALVKFDEWMMKNRDPKSEGLVDIRVPGESGWDNNKRYIQNEHLVQPESPVIKEKRYIQSADFNTYILIGRNIISRIASELGDDNLAKKYSSEAAKTAAGIKCMWSEKSGLFLDRFEDNHEQIPIKTPAGLIPMLAGIADEQQIKKLVENLKDKELFWSTYPVTTLDPNDPQYSSKDEYFSYWNGRVWPCVNWLIIESLRRSKQYETARELTKLTIRMCYASGEPECRENYNPVTGYPYFTDDTFNLSGFGGLFNDLLLRVVMGIQPNAPENEIYINPLMNGDRSVLSISGLEIGSHIVDIHLEQYEDLVKLKFSHRGEKPITLITSAGSVEVDNATIEQEINTFDSIHWLDLL